VKYFAPFRIDLAGQTIWRDDSRIPLTHKAFELLRVLVERAGHVVTRESLLAEVWPDTHVHPDNVKVLIGEIRRALGDDPERPRYIRSIVKRGYVFVAPVVEAPIDLSTAPQTPIFVGRGAEMDALLEAFDAACTADRRLTFVTGEAGIGKTALCEAFLRVAATRHAMRATWAQCINLSRPSEPYYPLFDALSRLARAIGDDTVESTLVRHAPSWIPHLPILSGESAHVVPPGARVASAARMLREIVSALEALTEQQTLVLWIEDLHWADPATIDVLLSLGQRRDPAKLMVLATMRPPESVSAAGSLRRAHADLVGHGRANEMRLQPLGRADVTRYLEARFGREVASHSTDVLARSTNGHPLFLVTAADDLVRKGHFSEELDGWHVTGTSGALEAAIPASFAGAVTHELNELAQDERRAIEAASVVGVDFSLWIVAHAAKVDELVLEPILEILARRQSFIVREGVVELANGLFSPLYRFKHGLYQEIVLEHIGSTLRAQTHANAGVAMERLFAGREREIAADLASHFHGAGDHARAARYLRLAADNALRRHAAREAAALLHGAVTHASHLSSDERAELELPLLLELGAAQFAAGEAALATMTWSRLERRCETEQRPDERLRALMALAEAHVGTHRNEALSCARRIADVTPFAHDAALAASAAIRAGIIEVQFVGWSDEIADRCQEAWRALAKSGTDDVRSLGIRLLLLHTLRSSYATVATAGRKLLPLALRSGNLTDCVYCYYWIAYAALHLGRCGEALEMAKEGAAVADRAGNSRFGASMRLVQAWIAIESQQWEEARQLSMADRSLIENAGWSNALQWSLLYGGAAALGLGALDDATSDLERLRDLYARERLLLDWFWEIHLHLSLTELALQRKDLERATSESRAAVDAALATPERTWRARAFIASAQVAIERKAFAEADRELRQARREIRGIDAPLAAWRLEAVTATLLERTAQPDSARRARMRYERTLNKLQRSIGRPAGHPETPRTGPKNGTPPPDRPGQSASNVRPS
jgi:DNA-binding winged helix-turn-helix (wHTH) protein